MPGPETFPNLRGTERLVRTVQELSLAQDLISVMQIVRTAARELTGADGATFVLRDEGYCFYAEEDAIAPLWKGSRFPMENCISGWVMLNRQSVFIEDIYADKRIPADAYRPTFVKSLAMVPIRTMDPIGAIGNYWADHRKPTDDEMTLLQALADITAVSIENIKTRTMLEEMVRERTEELAAALERERKLNELKSAFVSTASHEFRTPLATILTSSTLLEKYIEAQQTDKLGKHFSRIKTSVNGLIALLNDFLSLEKIEQGKIETNSEGFDLADFLRDVIEEVDGMRKPAQPINLTYTGDRNVWIDAKLLRNILLNLLSNAIKYSEEDIDVSADVTSEQLSIRVADKGIGIPENQKTKLFGKFFRASNVNGVEGTGLGLSIVKHYVSLLKGSIDFTSTEGKGTTFRLEIPVHVAVSHQS